MTAIDFSDIPELDNVVLSTLKRVRPRDFNNFTADDDHARQCLASAVQYSVASCSPDIGDAREKLEKPDLIDEPLSKEAIRASDYTGKLPSDS